MAGNPQDVIAWAALSLTQGDTFAGIKAPILDLYAGNDLPHVLASVAQRKASLSNGASQQRVIRDTDHYYAGHETEMINAVKTFLDGLDAPGPVKVSGLTGSDPTPFCPSWD